MRFRVPTDGQYSFAVADWEDDFRGRGTDSTGDYVLSASLAQPGVTPVLDTEPTNDTQVGADIVTPAADGSFLALGSLTPSGVGDVDFFAVDLAVGEVLTAVTSALSTDLLNPDTRLTLLDDSGNVIESNGDSGSDRSQGATQNFGKGSVSFFQALAAGTYYLAVTAEDDTNLDGGGTLISGDYALTVSVQQADLPLPLDSDFPGGNDCPITVPGGLVCSPDRRAVDVGRAESILAGFNNYDMISSRSICKRARCSRFWSVPFSTARPTPRWESSICYRRIRRRTLRRRRHGRLFSRSLLDHRGGGDLQLLLHPHREWPGWRRARFYGDRLR